jgi:hypothetical protein
MSRCTPTIFDHLHTMTDDRGLFEHADHARPRIEHGYCTDDNARLLVVTCRETDHEPADRLRRTALAFLIAAQVADGGSRNRMDASGTWTDEPSTEDCWGRSLWGLGAAAAGHPDPTARTAALTAFDHGARLRSPWTRAMVFAALGAADVLTIDPWHRNARSILHDAAVAIGRPGPAGWIWPQQRLTYANAALPEVLLAAGSALDDPRMLDDGLVMLDWLLTRQTQRGHLSVSGASGSDRHTPGPEFDQQPIEVAAMADACSRASALTGDARWADGVGRAAAWFDGANDAGAVMWDPDTGGGYDGLEPRGVNRNQGAESTLALISTRQRARALDPAAA